MKQKNLLGTQLRITNNLRIAQIIFQFNKSQTMTKLSLIFALMNIMINHRYSNILVKMIVCHLTFTDVMELRLLVILMKMKINHRSCNLLNKLIMEKLNDI